MLFSSASDNAGRERCLSHYLSERKSGGFKR